MSTLQFTLPDVLANWPYPRHLNPHYDIVAPESARWTESFNAFDAKAQKSFNKCDFGKLALLGWSLHDKARARSGCDLMNLFFVIDEHSDVEGEDGVEKMVEIVKDALKHPHRKRSADEWIGGEAARQFWERTIELATPTAQRRFLDSFFEYLDSVLQQAKDRTHNHIRSLSSYMEVRRDTIGCKPSYAMLELEMDIPDDVFNHPTLESLRVWSTDMICIANDIYSYNVEQARGDDLHNMVTIVMHNYKLDVCGAMEWIGEFNDRIAKSFLLAKDQVPSWGEPVDSQVARYVHGLGNWVRANDQWSFESERYFGKMGMDILKNRVVNMLPKQNPVEGIVINIPSNTVAPAKAVHPLKQFIRSTHLERLEGIELTFRNRPSAVVESSLILSILIILLLLYVPIFVAVLLEL